MQEILPAIEIVDKVLKQQKRRNAEIGLRRMLFCVEQEIEEGFLLYNLMTKRMVLLGKDEEKEREKELFEQWFLVEEDFDDIKGCSELSSFAQIYKKRVKGLTGYTILPTTGCNARCFYCFEKGAKHIHMDAEKALSVAKYIEKTHAEGKEIKILWFGGEPLLGVRSIDVISQYLRDHNISYTCDMVSNGYLFTSNIIEKGKTLWNLKKVQITLDGTEDVYNRTKAYLSKCENPYKRVINNIKALAEAEIKVNIRLNIGLENADNLLKLADELHIYFKELNNVGVYCHVLFENDNQERTFEERLFLYDKLKQLQSRLTNYGMFLGDKPKLLRQIKLNYCCSDSDDKVIIMPDGSLGKCEHFIDRDFFGHIDHEEQDKEILMKFRKRRSAIETCKTCQLFPECIRLEVCSELIHCYPEEREQAIERIKRGMVAEYERWKEKNKQ